MPSGDRTGPIGQGPMTGRGFGFCAGFDTPGYMKGFGRNMGRGFGFTRGIGGGMGRGIRRGMGRGFGFGRGYYAGMPFDGRFFDFPHRQYRMDKEEEIKLLKSQAEALNRTKKDIEDRISELENRA